MKTLKTQPLTILSLTLALLVSSAASMAERGERQGKRGAPPQAIEACGNLAVGDACEFEGRRGNISGVCFTPPSQEEVLACKPEGHEKRDKKESA